MQQILVLIDESNFILKCTVQVLCGVCVCVCVYVWGGGHVLCTHSFRSPHRKKFGTVISGDLACFGMSSECEISLWWSWQATSVLLPLHLVGNEGSWGHHEVLPTMEARRFAAWLHSAQR